MRESGNGQRTVFPWSDAQAPYVVGDTVYSGASRGTVVHVSDVVAALISVEWDDGKEKYGAIIYPAGSTFIRKAFPWE